MKPTFLLLLVFLLFSCNMQDKSKSGSDHNEKKLASASITVSEPTATIEGKIQGVYGGCGYNYTPEEEAITIYEPRQRELNQINSILNFTGLSSNFKIFSAKIENAVATIINRQRYIIYDPNLLSYTDIRSGNYWSSMSILAHEIGHHLSGHTLSNNGSNPQDELEADKYSGFILYKLGATLIQANSAIMTLGKETASATHPAKSDRIKAISKGWNEANQQRFTSAVPPPPSDNVSAFKTYTYDMLIDEKNIQEGIIEEEYYSKYDFFYGIVKEAKVNNFQVESIKIHVKSTGQDWKRSVGSLDGETINVSLDDYWRSASVANIPAKSLPNLLVPGRRIKFAFVEGLYGGTAESGYFRLTYVKGLEGNSF